MIMQDSIKDFDKESEVEEKKKKKTYETGDWGERISAFLEKWKT